MSKSRPKKPKNAAHVPEAGQQPAPEVKPQSSRRLVTIARPREVVERDTDAQPDEKGVVVVDGVRCFVTDEPEQLE